MIVTACNIFGRAKDLLPHYFKHYSGLGIDRFYFGVHGEENSHIWEELRYFGKGLDVRISKMPTDKPFDCGLDAEFKTQIGNSIDGWIVPTDLDEFHTVDGYSDFHQLAKDCESENADYVFSHFLDRIAADGSIPLTIDPAISIWEQFPRMEHISATILGERVNTNKLCLSKAGIPFRIGHHHAGLENTEAMYKQFSKVGVTHHFKWFGELKKRELDKLAANTPYKFYFSNDWTLEHMRLINYVESHGGKLI